MSDQIGQNKSQCSSFGSDREENFESYGENDDAGIDADDNMESPNFPYLMEGCDIDVVDRAEKPCSNENSLRSIESASNFRRTSPQRNSIRTKAWMRSSLRKGPLSSNPSPVSGNTGGATNSSDHYLVPPRRTGSFRMPKRASSNAYASALYHNSNNGSGIFGRDASFISSNSRASSEIGDEERDMQSDISLEEDVNDLNQRVHQLQEQVSHLVDSQATTDERYSKVKQENASLNQKILMLDEHIRELELRSEERIQTEQKRNKDSMQRLEREKQLEIENYTIKFQNLERDYNRAQEEIGQLRSAIERLRLDKSELEEQLNEAHAALSSNDEDIRKLEEAAKRESERSKEELTNSSHLVNELQKEVESLREQLRARTSGKRQAYASNNASQYTNGDLTRLNSTDSAFSLSTEDRMGTRVIEMESEIKSLKESNRILIEANEELHAQVLNRGLEEGKAVLFNHDTAKANLESMSIARELEGLSDSQMSHGTLSDELCQVRQALNEQQDVNEGLRGYIDGILMNIMEKYPELLEVRK